MSASESVPAARRARTALVCLACLAGLLSIVSCRRPTPPAPLKEDPDVAARLAEQRADQKLYGRAVKLTRDEVASLEADVRKNPEDLSARKSLLVFYRLSGQQQLGWDRMIAARRPHLLWIIEHHPDTELAVFPGVSEASDPAGYREAKKRWLEQTAKPDVRPAVLANAASFFEISDRPLAEKLLLRGKAIEPDGPTPRIEKGYIYNPTWTERLATVYALAIVGSTGGTLGNIVHRVSREEAQSAYATQVRRTMDETQDPALLTAVGRYLLFNASSVQVDFDRRVLAVGYLERAAKIQPAGEVRRILASLEETRKRQALEQKLRAQEVKLAGGEIASKVEARATLSREERQFLDDLEPQAVNALTDAEKLAYLPHLAALTYSKGETADHDHDPRHAAAYWDRSKAYARDLLSLAARYNSDAASAAAVYQGNIVLSLNALREGDVRTSLRHLRAAAEAPAFAESPSFPLDTKLAGYLLNAGERDSVTDFLERAAGIVPARKDQFLKDAAAIRAGRMPEFHQLMSAPR